MPDEKRLSTVPSNCANSNLVPAAEGGYQLWRDGMLLHLGEMRVETREVTARQCISTFCTPGICAAEKLK